MGTIGVEMGKPVEPAPAALCPACAEKRVHTVSEWTEFHRYARHGYSEGIGWTHPDLERLAGAADLANVPKGVE